MIVYYIAKATTTHVRFSKKVKGHDSVTSPFRVFLNLCYSVHKCPKPHTQVTVLWLERVKENVHVNRQVKGAAVFRHQRNVLRGQSKRRITQYKPQYLNGSWTMKRLIPSSLRSTLTVKKLTPYATHTSAFNADYATTLGNAKLSTT